ncbi:hypothetical protein TNCV_3786011 [Trichonephila clavipes]|nr:hypothetical protein TNCV_3786011 [Trichonephila clavipes]
MEKVKPSEALRSVPAENLIDSLSMSSTTHRIINTAGAVAARIVSVKSTKVEERMHFHRCVFLLSRLNGAIGEEESALHGYESRV